MYFFRKQRNGNNILLINTGKIGDLIVSSIILENDIFFNNNIYLFFSDRYFELFDKYKGIINLLTFDYDKYRWNIFYRIRILNYLRKIGIKEVYNISPARGMISEELTFLCGAENHFTTCKNLKYLKKYYGKMFNKKYNNLLYQDVYNEYKKIILLVKRLASSPPHEMFLGNKKALFIKDNIHFSTDFKKGEFILIAPMVSQMERSWGAENYKNLAHKLSLNHSILLIGSESEKEVLNYISGNNKSVRVITPSLRDTPSVINYCKLFIGNNSGLSHIALKLNKPLVAILDGGYFDMYFPFKENEKIKYVYNKMDCFGCDWKCKFDEPICLTNISLQTVFNSVNCILKKVK